MADEILGVRKLCCNWLGNAGNIFNQSRADRLQLIMLMRRSGVELFFWRSHGLMFDV